MQQAPHALYLRLLAVVAAALVCVALAGRIRDTALVDVQTIANKRAEEFERLVTKIIGKF